MRYCLLAIFLLFAPLAERTACAQDIPEANESELFERWFRKDKVLPVLCRYAVRHRGQIGFDRSVFFLRAVGYAVTGEKDCSVSLVKESNGYCTKLTLFRQEDSSAISSVLYKLTAMEDQGMIIARYREFLFRRLIRKYVDQTIPLYCECVLAGNGSSLSVYVNNWTGDELVAMHEISD